MALTIIDFKPPFDGYAMIEDDTIYLSVISVDSESRGKGFFRKLIQDTKATYRVVKVPQPSPFLHSVLLRYGFKETYEWNDNCEENILVMLWEKEAE